MVLISLTLLFIITKPCFVLTTCTIENLLASNVEVYYNNEIQNDPASTVVDGSEVNVICNRAEDYFVNPYANTESNESLLRVYCIADNIFKKFEDLDNNNQVSFPLTCQAHSTFENYCLPSSIPQGQPIQTQYPFLKAYEKDHSFQAICAEGKILNMNIFLHCDGNDNWIIKINGNVIDRVPNQFCPEQSQPCVSSTDQTNHLVSTSTLNFNEENDDGSYGSVACITDNVDRVSFDALCGNGNFLYVVNSKIIEETAESLCAGISNACKLVNMAPSESAYKNDDFFPQRDFIFDGEVLQMKCTRNEFETSEFEAVCVLNAWTYRKNGAEITESLDDFCERCPKSDLLLTQIEFSGDIPNEADIQNGAVFQFSCIQESRKWFIFTSTCSTGSWIYKYGVTVFPRDSIEALCEDMDQRCLHTDLPFTTNNILTSLNSEYPAEITNFIVDVSCITVEYEYNLVCTDKVWAPKKDGYYIHPLVGNVCESARNSCDESSFINLFASFEDQERYQKELEGSELNVYCPNDEAKLHGIKIVCEATQWKLIQGDLEISDNFFNYCLKLEHVCQNEILTNFNLTLPAGLTTMQYSLAGDAFVATCSLNNTETNVPLVCSEKNWKFDIGLNAGGSVNATSLSSICDAIVVNTTTNSTSGVTILRVVSSVYLFAVMIVVV